MNHDHALKTARQSLARDFYPGRGRHLRRHLTRALHHWVKTLLAKGGEP